MGEPFALTSPTRAQSIAARWRRTRRLRPFFSFYGMKFRLAPSYPPPRHRVLVEYCAGGAGYATWHHDRQVLLFDVSPFVVGVWDYLIRVRGAELRRLPDRVDSIEDLRAPQEARWLVGFWLNTAQVYPSNAPTSWARSGEFPEKFWGPIVREMLAQQVELIRHWRVKLGSYETAPDVNATWFVDPPYRGPPGEKYRRFRMRPESYGELGDWCRARRGQVIVCENVGATWLPFRPHRSAAALKGRSLEAIWTNEPSPQLGLFGQEVPRG